VARAKDWLIALLVLLLGRGRPRRPDRPPRIVEPHRPDPRAELVTLALLGCSSLCAVAFIVVYAVDSIPAQTQWLGVASGFALLFLAAALIVTGRKLVPEEELIHEYPPVEHPRDEEVVEQLLEEGTDGITRRRLLKLGMLGATGTLGLAALTPALSFGPLFRVKDLFATPWRRGRRLVDEAGTPWRASAIEEGAFYTAFPEGADRDAHGSPLVLVRLPQDALDLPSDLAGYDAGGIVAYSKVCTHAGCAISMYRVPLFAEAEPRPALVCPCHYSTFDPATGGTVLFGPAGRRLPMLPVEADGKGNLRARGNFGDPPGPSWWGVRNRKPTP
jgi:ubiquinol-cytochrome c reductase iron-sulfur subunit